MHVGTLAGVPLSQLTAAFNSAFGDYSVPISLSDDRLGEMLRRRGFRANLSVGVFENESLIGITFNGFGTWRGRLTGYDTGTGVVPEARGRGAARLMLDKTKELMRDAGAEAYFLEVIQSNEIAARLYRGLGFEITRELLCYTIADVAPARPVPGCMLERVDTIDWPGFRAMWNRDPSWQNSSEAIDRALDERAVIVATMNGSLVGYAIVFPFTGDLPQMAVAPGQRLKGVGRALLNEARVLAGKPLRILNIDSRDVETIGFLTRRGTAEIVRQYEMMISL